jgi:hypothetical protein
MLRVGFSPMLLELQVRQVHIHILLVIWGLAEEEETSQLKRTWLNSNTTQIFFVPPPAPIFFKARAEIMKGIVAIHSSTEW